MIHTTPPRIQSRMVAPAETQNVKVIIDAFSNPRAATKHEAQIGRLMLKHTKRETIPQTHKRDSNAAQKRKKQIFDYCLNSWRTTEDIAQFMSLHVETVRKVAKAMLDEGKLDRKQNPETKLTEYVYKSRDTRKTGNEWRTEARATINEQIVNYCSVERTSQEIADKFGISLSGTRYHLQDAQRDGKVEKLGSGNKFTYLKVTK
jgi:DNA-binding CsgD family transcriptional regulator